MVKTNNIDPLVVRTMSESDQRPESDWDLLILINSRADPDHEKLFRHKLYEIELETEQSFSVFAYNREDWRLNHRMTTLYQNISKEGLRI